MIENPVTPSTLPIRPIESDRSHAYHNKFIRALSVHRQYLAQYRLVQTVVEKDLCLIKSESSLRDAILMAIKRVTLEDDPYFRNHPNGAKGAMEFRHWLQHTVWSKGGFLLLSCYYNEIGNSEKAEDMLCYVEELQSLITEMTRSDDTEPAEKVDFVAFQGEFNELCQTRNSLSKRLAAISGSRVSTLVQNVSSITTNLVRNLYERIRSFFTKLIDSKALIRYVSLQDASWKAKLNEVIAMAVALDVSSIIDYRLKQEDDNDEPIETIKQHFLNIFEDIKIKIDLGGEYTEALLDRVEASIALCQEYEQENLIKKAYDDFVALANDITERAKHAINRIYEENSIWDPIITALKIVGWIVVAPYKRIVYGKEAFDQYNQSIVEQFRRTPWAVIVALLGVGGIGAGLAYGGMALMGGAATISTALAHVAGGTLLFLGGAVGGALIGFKYREALVDAEYHQLDSAIVRARRESDRRLDLDLQVLHATNNPETLRRMKTLNQQFAEMLRQNDNNTQSTQEKQAQQGASADQGSLDPAAGVSSGRSTRSARNVDMNLGHTSVLSAADRATIQQSTQQVLDNMTKEDCEDALREIRRGQENLDKLAKELKANKTETSLADSAARYEVLSEYFEQNLLPNNSQSAGSSSRNKMSPPSTFAQVVEDMPAFSTREQQMMLRMHARGMSIDDIAGTFEVSPQVVHSILQDLRGF